MAVEDQAATTARTDVGRDEARASVAFYHLHDLHLKAAARQTIREIFDDGGLPGRVGG